MAFNHWHCIERACAMYMDVVHVDTQTFMHPVNVFCNTRDSMMTALLQSRQVLNGVCLLLQT